MRRLAASATVTAVALVAAPAATAKEFRPGDLRLCNAKRCVAIMDERLADAMTSFVYAGPQPAVAARVRLRSPYYELRFRNGYVAGIVATARLDRWLSYGVILERFERGRWYVVPPATAAALRRVTTGLAPMRLSFVAVSKSR